MPAHDEPKREDNHAAAELLPTSLVGSYSAARLADRPQEARRPLSAAGARAGSCGAWRPNGSSRRRTTPRCWPSATRSAPVSTSSPTARCGARATRTASPPRSRASTSTIPAPRSTAAAIPTRCRASSARSRRKHPVEVRDVQFLRANTDRMIKMTVPGPFTMSQQAQNDFYKDEEEMALDYAAAVNAEIKDLFAAGADVVQIDEPYMQARPEKARAATASRRSTRALDGVDRHDRGAHLLRLRRDHPRAAGGLFVPARARRLRRSSRSRSRPRSPSSTARCWRSCRRRPSFSACSTSPT